MVVPSFVASQRVKRNRDNESGVRVGKLEAPGNVVRQRRAQESAHVLAPAKLQPMYRLAKRSGKERQRARHTKGRLVLIARGAESFILNWVPTAVTDRRRNRFQRRQALPA